ncbi:MAG: hypothetical protein ACJ73E_00120 [Mycobacteriales bacterium]
MAEPDIDLGRELRALGRQLDVPPAPDVTLAVRARLEAPAPRRTPVLRYALVILLVLLAAVLAVPPVRAAVLDFFRIGGVEIHQGSGPPLPPTPVLTDRPVAGLDEAERLTGIRARPPGLLGRPDEVRVIEGRVVSLGWRPTGDRPTARLDVFGGQLDPVFLKYLQFRDATEVDVRGVPGWYVPGPHEVVYVDPGGSPRAASARLAGPTLIWQRDGTTYRLEADLPPPRLVAVGASVPAG